MIRLVTYNVHRCLGSDGTTSPSRIAEVLASCEPDIVALQELDVNRARSGGVDQAEAIARELGMHMHFHPALEVLDERYGDALLTARPAKLLRAERLPGSSGSEPRGALAVSVKVGKSDVRVITTHLGLRGPDRLLQLEALLRPAWIGSPSRDPVVLAGDLNALPRSRAYARVAAHLRDAQVVAPSRRPRPTFPALLPVLRIDHVFVSTPIEVLRAEPVRTPLAKIASDHLPLIVDFDLPPSIAIAAEP